jgi:hypothetical protein
MGDGDIAASRQHGLARRVAAVSLGGTMLRGWREQFGLRVGGPKRGAKPIKQSDSEKRTPHAGPFAQEYRPDVDGLRAIAVGAVITGRPSCKARPNWVAPQVCCLIAASRATLGLSTY